MNPVDALFPDLHPALSPQAAVVEANRCLYCYDAPCTQACPTHIDVPKFIQKIATGNLRGSANTILDANVLGLSCSRVCPVDVLCEGNCVMHLYNKQPIEIGLLQRHAMDFFYSHEPQLASCKDNGKKVACIGAGPASLSCAAELRRHGFSVTIFDKNPLPGGLNTYGIAQYKLRPPDSLKEVDLVRNMGVEFRQGEPNECDYDAIFLGIGLGAIRRLNIPGEIDALKFIADYKNGQPKVGRMVAVIGAGNTAIDAAIAAKLLGAVEVHLLYRRGESDMSAFANEYEHAKQAGVQFRWWTEISPDHPYDMVITAIGQSSLRDVTLISRETGQTTNPKIFAGGDCINGGREVVDAVADGKRAAIGIKNWLSGQSL